MKNPVIEKLVIDIMQSGFDVAMGGDAFKSVEENVKLQVEQYNQVLKTNQAKLNTIIASRVKEAELRGRIDELKYQTNLILSEIVAYTESSPSQWISEMEKRIAELASSIKEGK